MESGTSTETTLLIHEAKPEIEVPDAYAPGVPSEQILRGALLRFLPSSVLSLTIVAALVGPFGFTQLAGAVLLSAGLTAGYLGALGVLGRWLYPDAEVHGRRSVVSGLLAPIAMLIPTALGLTSGLLASPLIGLLLALVMFVAWLSPTPDLLLTDEVNQADQ